MLSIVSGGQDREHTRSLVAVCLPPPPATRELRLIDGRLERISDRIVSIDRELLRGNVMYWRRDVLNSERAQLQGEQDQLEAERLQHMSPPPLPKVKHGGKQLSPGTPTPYVRTDNDNVQLGIAPEPKSKRPGDNPLFSVVVASRLEEASH